MVHVVNRAVRRGQLFVADADYAAFERVLVQALAKVPTRLVAFSLMPSHWHLVIWPRGDELPRFMQWLTAEHAKRWHRARGSQGSGHVYKNRYHAVPVQGGPHLFTVVRYVERNALRAGLVTRAEDWPWGSLWHRCRSSNRIPLDAGPIALPEDWVSWVNEPVTKSELAAIRNAVRRSTPFGDDEWSKQTAQTLGTARRRPGRPSNNASLA